MRIKRASSFHFFTLLPFHFYIMDGLKNLAKDTAIYGLSSIIGRFINYLLVPIQTAKFAASGGEYGIVTNIYAYTALLLVLLTYGMETTFFRYVNKSEENPNRVYATTLMTVGFTSLLFIIVVLAFLNPISSLMGYADHRSYVAVMFICVALDAFQCIPFAYLRYKKRPIKFAALKLVNISMNIFLNVLYLIVLPALQLNPFGIYDSHFTLDVGYVFYINLFCTAFVFVFLAKELQGFRYSFDKALLKRMISYSWPILVLGIAGILNQTADKILFPYIYRGADAHTQLGIYGAASKVAMIMAMITQAFRYAYEPFVFGKAKDRDNRATYAQAMKYFIIFTLLAFLVVIGYLNVLRHIIGHDYWSGLRVVPIVMAAEIMMGIYFNLSFWYKLIDKTIWGAYFSGVGCAVLIVINVVFVPRFGYIACAWAGFIGYATAMTLSYIVGQKKYPIAYPVREITTYVLLTAVIFYAMTWTNSLCTTPIALFLNTVLILLFLAYILKHDFPLSSLPVVGRYFEGKRKSERK